MFQSETALSSACGAIVTAILLVGVALGIGGVLKGATGAGPPLVAIPALAALFDVQFAVAVMLVPNLITNLWQAWHFRGHMRANDFVRTFSLAGAAGVAAGTAMLANFPGEILSVLVAASVSGYVAFRLARADWIMPPALAARLYLPMGLAAGLLQGASGISAPVSLSFLNAIRLERPVFIATISMFFTSMTAVQIPFAAWFGILTPERVAVSALAILPIVACMPLGAFLARHVSRDAFDRVILVLLSALALKLVADVVL